MLDIQLILLLLISGSIAGFIAGLFGIGGGIIVIPVTLWVLNSQQVNQEHIQHIAIGTSFTVMLFTTFVSSLAQYKQKAILWSVLKPMAPGIILGSFTGSFLASYIPSKNLQVVFIAFCYLIALRTLLGFKAKSSWSLPGKAGLFGVSSSIGTLSSLLGIGGGILNVPFMLASKIPIKQAIGTSAALSWTISLIGVISYLILGLKTPNLPEGTLGFCYLPIAITLAITTSLFAPLGVKLAHKLPSKFLQSLFAILILVVSTQILFKWVIN